MSYYFSLREIDFSWKIKRQFFYHWSQNCLENLCDLMLWMLKKSWISKNLKNQKIVKHFTRPKQQAASRKLFRLTPAPPPTIRSYFVFGTKIFLRTYIETYRHLLSKCFKNSVFECQEMMRANFFSDTKQKHVCWKICKVRQTFGCVLGAYCFQCQVSWVS